MIRQLFLRQKMENNVWMVHAVVDEAKNTAEIQFYGKDNHAETYAIKWGFRGTYDGKVRLITDGLTVVGMLTLGMDQFWGTHQPHSWEVTNPRHIFYY